MRISLTAVLLVLFCQGRAAAQPLTAAHSVELVGAGRIGLPQCKGLAFLADGARLAVLWEGPPERINPPPPGVPRDEPVARTTLSIVGRPGDDAEHDVLSVAPLRTGVFGGNELTIDRTGALILVDAPKHLVRREVGAKLGDRLGQPTLLAPSSPLLPRTRLWSAGPPGTLYVASWTAETAYSLRRLDPGLPPNETQLGATSVLRGGERDHVFLGADVHRSGRWFAATTGSPLGEKGQLDLWEITDAPRKRTILLPVQARCVAFSPDTKEVAVGLTNGSVGFYNTADAAAAREPVRLGQFTVATIAFHPQGQLLACGTFDRDGTHNLFVIHPATGRAVARFSADPRGIVALCFNATGTRLATFGGSGRVTLWDTSNLAVPPK